MLSACMGMAKTPIRQIRRRLGRSYRQIKAHQRNRIVARRPGRTRLASLARLPPSPPSRGRAREAREGGERGRRAREEREEGERGRRAREARERGEGARREREASKRGERGRREREAREGSATPATVRPGIGKHVRHAGPPSPGALWPSSVNPATCNHVAAFPHSSLPGQGTVAQAP